MYNLAQDKFNEVDSVEAPYNVPLLCSDDVGNLQVLVRLKDFGHSGFCKLSVNKKTKTINCRALVKGPKFWANLSDFVQVK